MITVNQAVSIIKSSVVQLKTEYIYVENAINRILATDIKSKADSPPFDMSSMDGYAVKINKNINHTKFKVIDEIIKITSKKYRDVSYIDGIRVNLSHGWWLIRASNTQPAIIVRCEANSKKSLITLIKEVDLILLKFDLKLNY